MASVSKAWDWEKGIAPVWLEPSEESYYVAARWKNAGYKRLLDFGCGLGRHSIYFAKQGFDVTAFDLSEQGVAHLDEWAGRENLCVTTKVADMLALPFPDASFDCLYAYHVISHTDTANFLKAVSEIKRVLAPGGEFFITLCSKKSSSFLQAGYPRLDDNTVVKTGGGAEDGIPHFYVELDDIFVLLKDFYIIRIRHTDDCFFDNLVSGSKHYFVLGRNGERG